MSDEKLKVLIREVLSNNDLTSVIISYLEFMMLLKMRETSTLMLLVVSKEGQKLVEGFLGFQYKKQFTMTRQMFRFIKDQRVKLIRKEVPYDIENNCFPSWVTHNFSGFNNGRFNCLARNANLQWKFERFIREAGLVEVSSSETLINYTFNESGIKTRVHHYLMDKFHLRDYFY